MTTETRPPIPASLAHRPVRGGLAMPWANAELADGGVDFRSPHHTRYAKAWQECRCQSCGRPTGDPAVLICGPRQILSRQFDEPSRGFSFQREGPLDMRMNRVAGPAAADVLRDILRN